MRVMCGVHGASEHWMHHIAAAARLATVCRRLRSGSCLVISRERLQVLLLLLPVPSRASPPSAASCGAFCRLLAVTTGACGLHAGSCSSCSLGQGLAQLVAHRRTQDVEQFGSLAVLAPAKPYEDVAPVDRESACLVGDAAGQVYSVEGLHASARRHVDFPHMHISVEHLYCIRLIALSCHPHGRRGAGVQRRGAACKWAAAHRPPIHANHQKHIFACMNTFMHALLMCRDAAGQVYSAEGRHSSAWRFSRG